MFKQGSKIFITGATGFLGRHLLQHLQTETPAEIYALVRDNAIEFKEASEQAAKVHAVKGNLENFSDLETIIRRYQPDTVFHLAGQAIVQVGNANPLGTFQSNIQGTWNLLEAIRQQGQCVQRVVVASSAHVYGKLAESPYKETTPLQADIPYDVSKSCADLIARTYANAYRLPVCVARCANFFGPGDFNFSRIIPGTIREVLEGKNPVIRSHGKFVRDFLYVEDAALAYATLASRMSDPALHGEAFNFSYGVGYSILDIVTLITEMMGRPDLKPVVLNQASQEIPVQVLNSDKARTRLEWKPAHGFIEGLQRTIQWYTERLTPVRAKSSSFGLGSTQDKEIRLGD